METDERRVSGAALGFKLVPIALLLCLVGGRLFGASSHGATRGPYLATLVFVGLAFSLAGDLAIAFSFVSGLGLFLCAHLAYIAAMGWSREQPVSQLIAFLPALLLWSSMLAILVRRVPPALRGPVVVYVTVISIMLGRAASRALVTAPGLSAGLFLAGAAFFVVSDALIALDKWVVRIPRAQAFILTTYYAAQGLIAWAAIR